jgi:hypothetical protein
VTRQLALKDSEFVSLGHSGPQHLRIVGGKKLSGSIPVKTSKNAAVALLCASLLNKGRTTLRSLARIEEVNRIIEVLTSIGVRVRWLPDSNDLEIIPPAQLDLASIDVEAARRTRTVIMFFGPLLHELSSFQLPYAGGCDLGTRTIEPHLSALRPFGLDVAATHGFYEARVGTRVLDDPYQSKDLSIGEARYQFDLFSARDWGDIKVKGDAYGDFVEEQADFDLREANVFVRPTQPREGLPRIPSEMMRCMISEVPSKILVSRASRQ